MSPREDTKKTGVVNLRDLPDSITVSVDRQLAAKIVKDAIGKAGSRKKLALKLFIEK